MTTGRLIRGGDVTSMDAYVGDRARNLVQSCGDDLSAPAGTDRA